ncbi:hypothetical protein OPV22_006174 [Ensete ventricosum]|uniref:Uncharacterized protein n=1 Tax=Ensete ventricosum TaxID=4639 RepID=A0AAV8RSH9_ENSVE|nr:hypothetical protein OPV22_006174 [Ensete ventricosum]
MKCERHPFETGVGVCASCLRQRLLAITAPAQAASSPEHPSPLPFPFPRSVSPYGSRRTAGSRRYSSVVSALFGQHEPGDRDRKPQKSRSWLSALLRGRRKKNMSSVYPPEDAAAGSSWDPEPEFRYGAKSPCRSWHRKRPPMREPTGEHHHRDGDDPTRFATCFSPLMIASCSRRRSRMEEIGFSKQGPHHRRRASTGGPLLYADPPPKLAAYVTVR